VALIYGEKQPAGKWFLSTAAYDANFTDHFDYQIFIKNAAGVSSTRALAAVKAVATGYPGTKVLDQAGYKADQTKFVDQMLGLVYALLALAILIALLGIGNTLGLSILERTRELGVMRAVGMTRSQLRSAIRWESVLIALQGTLLGLGVGVFFGWALTRALRDQGFVAFSLPVRSLAVIVVLAALAGVVAAILPARRAARLNVLRAVVTE
jgi:putative ABC transport system permease protein